MPVMSYLAYPAEGESEQLQKALEDIPECEVQPADNAELLVLVTDTEDPAREKELSAQIQAIPSLSFLALVSAYADPVEEKPSNTDPQYRSFSESEAPRRK